jgi:hypothetical protein
MSSLAIACLLTLLPARNCLTANSLNCRLSANLSARVRVILWLAVYCHSVHLGTKPHVSQNQAPPPPRNLTFMAMAILLVTHPPWWFVSYEYAWPLSSVHIAHIACYWKFFLSQNIQVLCQSRLCKADHAYLIWLMLQWQRNHLSGHSLTTAEFKLLKFSVSGFTLSYAMNMVIFVSLYDYFLLPA